MAYQLLLPDIGEGVVEAEVVRWLVAEGDAVAEDQPLVEVMTDKATVVIPSPRRGTIRKLLWKVGELAQVHAPLVEIETGEGARAVAVEVPREAVGPAVAPVGPAGAAGAGAVAVPTGRKALAAPAVRAMARELGIAIDAVAGTGPGGRVTKDDLAAVKARRNGHAAGGKPSTSTSTSTRADAIGDERVPLRGLRRKIAENMARSKRTAAHFTFVEQCDVTELVRVKDRMAAAAREEGVKLTFLPFVLKAVVEALRRHPRLNATMDEERGELVQHGRYDLGVAASTEAGLTVPVVRGVDRRSLLDVAKELERVSAAAKAGQLRPDDVGRSTFTVTSLGALGGLFATPVLNHPEVGILGVHRIRPTPVVREGAVVVRDVMHLSVTSDHRVVDGDEAARFAYEVIRMLEAPELLFLRLG
jgi:pyruvate dehydrogenase E2 component (dihydrolipoamide acetyltransferase)